MVMTRYEALPTSTVNQAPFPICRISKYASAAHMLLCTGARIRPSWVRTRTPQSRRWMINSTGVKQNPAGSCTCKGNNNINSWN